MVHWPEQAIDGLGQSVVSPAVNRLSDPDPELGISVDATDIADMAGNSISPEGIGGDEAFRLFAEVIEPSCLAVDHPRFFSFIPAAPTRSSLLADLLLSSTRIYGGSWMEGAGAVYVENQVLRWIADLCGLPEAAGGVFVPGGTNGNLSSMIAARYAWRQRGAGRHDAVRGVIISSDSVHASVPQAARAMDCEMVCVPGDDAGRLCRETLQRVLRALGNDRDRVFAVVATAGTTNAGVIDDLDAAADAADDLGCWLHVDGAYGLAAVCSEQSRGLFAGVERADSLIVDPHKWLFGPFDSCALLYRDPAIARAAHTQRADYLEVLQSTDDQGTPGWNPSDYAHHLSRRPRGLPLWFSLASHGTTAYAEAIETTLAVAREGAELIRSASHLELLLEPDLTVLVFRRRGWTHANYVSWAREVMEEGTAVVLPTQWKGETALRMCIVNPDTTIGDIKVVVDRLL